MRTLGRRLTRPASPTRSRLVVSTRPSPGISSGPGGWTGGFSSPCTMPPVRRRPPSCPGCVTSRCPYLTPDESDTQLLALKLLDSNQRDIFQTLCLDIISTAAQADSEAEAVSAALMRTWRWHHLLRVGRGTLLSPEEQKGLLGELFVLERLLLPRMDASSAVTAWRGPLGAPKDFEIARVAIEAKTRRGGATPSLSITSESQLDERRRRLAISACGRVG